MTRPPDPVLIDADAQALLAGRHIATLSTHRADGSIHVVPVAFMHDPSDGLVRIIAPAPTQKVKHIRDGSAAVLSFVDGGLWMTVEGDATVRDEAVAVARALDDYTAKYGPPHGQRTDYVAIELRPSRVMGRFSLPGRPS